MKIPLTVDSLLCDYRMVPHFPFTCTALSLRSTLDSMATPCSVNAYGGYRRPPHELEVPNWYLKFRKLLRSKLKGEVIDFGFMLELDDTLWELFRKMDRPLTTGRRDERIAALKEWLWIGDDPADRDRLRLSEEYADWSWRSRYRGGEFDFGDEADFRHGVDLFVQMVRKRYSRARPCTPVIARQHFGWRSILYRLQARIDVAPIAEEEIRATGWDRSDYARAG